jgi:transcriptional regulator with XRE-family HTH domain
MTDSEERWGQVGAAIAARMAGPPAITMAELVRRSGVSDTSIRDYLRGKPIVRADKRRELCAGLGWTADSIDLILAGKKPRIATDARSTDLALRSLTQRVEALEEGRAEMLRLLRQAVGEDASAPGRTPPGDTAAHPELPT